MNRELYETRKIQSLEKERRLEDQGYQDRDDFQRIIINQKQERDIEVKLEQERKEKIKLHQEELKKQMQLNEEKRNQDKRNHLEEGRNIQNKIKSQKQLLHDIKATKLNALNSSGIPAKYQYDLAKKKINS